jgi:hypothetical protein
MDVHEHEPDEQSDDDGNYDPPNDIALLLRNCFLGRLIGSVNGFYDRVDAPSYSTGHIPGPEPRHDFISNDLCRSGVGQYALQSVPDFNADLAFPDRHHQQDAVVGTLVTEFPGGRYAMGKFFEGFPFEGGDDQDGHLIARLSFMGRQLRRQRFNRGARQDMGEIDDPPCQRRGIKCMREKSEGQDGGQG